MDLMSRTSRIVRFLQDNVLNVDLFAIEHGVAAAGVSPVVSAPLGLVSYTVNPGELLSPLMSSSKIKGIAHSHVPEQRDMYESWVDFSVKHQI